jgi:hypothetical protein
MTSKLRFKLRKGTRLPYWEEAYIDPEKLTRYALDPEHTTGGHKAVVFASVLGIYREDWRYLHDQILRKLPQSDATRCELDTPWGPRWEVPILIEGRNARHRYVVTSWLTPWRGRPHLTSTYVEKSERNRELEAQEESFSAYPEARDASEDR